MKLPEDLKAKVENMTRMQRLYCEFRAKGISQSESMLRAGSDSKDPESRGRIGYQIEQIDGAKDYIQYQKELRSQAAGLDVEELITYFRDAYHQAMATNHVKEAILAAEQLGRIIGVFGKGGMQVIVGKEKAETKNEVGAFKEEEADTETKDRITTLQGMLRELNTSNDKS